MAAKEMDRDFRGEGSVFYQELDALMSGEDFSLASVKELLNKYHIQSLGQSESELAASKEAQEVGGKALVDADRELCAPDLFCEGEGGIEFGLIRSS